MMTLDQARQWLGLETTGRDEAVLRVCTDSRQVQAGDLFVALRGPRFDGHDYVAAALAAGAAGAVVDHVPKHHFELLDRLLLVHSTDQALSDLARAWRLAIDPTVLAVTGSNGKTTVKEMLTAIVTAHVVLNGGDPAQQVLATQGNLNNTLGLPMTLLRLRPGHRWAVVEMGMNHAGEIARMTRVALPRVALVNNVQRAHVGLLGGVEGVARAKAEIFEGLTPDGVAVFPAASAQKQILCQGAQGHDCVEFALKPAQAHLQPEVNPQAEAAHLQPDANPQAGAQSSAMAGAVWGSGASTAVMQQSMPRQNLAAAGTGAPRMLWGESLANSVTENRLRICVPEGGVDVRLQVLGRHNQINALAASAVAWAAGIELAAIVQGLQTYTGIKGRLQPHLTAKGACILDDTYNANPDSVMAAIDVLAEHPGHRVLVLGDLGELGHAANTLHAELGQYARQAGIDECLTLGELSSETSRVFGPGAQHFNSLATLVQSLRERLNVRTVVLVKGSRFMQMERVVQGMLA